MLSQKKVGISAGSAFSSISPHGLSTNGSFSYLSLAMALVLQRTTADSVFSLILEVVLRFSFSFSKKTGVLRALVLWKSRLLLRMCFFSTKIFYSDWSVLTRVLMRDRAGRHLRVLSIGGSLSSQAGSSVRVRLCGQRVVERAAWLGRGWGWRRVEGGCGCRRMAEERLLGLDGVGSWSVSRYFMSHWNLVLTRVLRMMYLWLCLGMNCVGRAQQRFCINLTALQCPSNRNHTQLAGEGKWRMSSQRRGGPHCHRRGDVSLPLRSPLRVAGTCALLGGRQTALLRGEVLVVGEVGALDVVLARELPVEGLAGLQQVPEVEVQVRLLGPARGGAEGEFLGLDAFVLGEAVGVEVLLVVAGAEVGAELAGAVGVAGGAFGVGALGDAGDGLDLLAFDGEQELGLLDEAFRVHGGAEEVAALAAPLIAPQQEVVHQRPQWPDHCPHSQFLAHRIKLTFMSAKTYSDEQELPEQAPSLETLLNENRMKDLAVKKATNLIQLLNIELEVERNSHHEAARLLEQQLRQEQADNHRLRTQINVLERTIQAQSSPEHPTKRHDSRLNISRANSLHSLQKRKRSVNKKYTEQTVESTDRQPHSHPVLLFGNALIKQQIVEIQLWKNHAIQELAELVKTEYDELGQIISQIEAINEDFEELGRQKPRLRGSAKGEDLVALIKAQQATINAQRHYAQQLEDLLSTAHSHLLPPSLPAPAPCPPLPTDGMLTALRKKRAEWAGEVGGLEAENSELKNILDNMIALVREEKRGRG